MKKFTATIFLSIKILKSILLLTVISIVDIQSSYAQSVSFDIKESPNISFVFNTINSYQAGLNIPNANTLKIIATGTNWDLYVGATTTVPGQWDVIQTYSSTGTLPQTDIVQLRFRNTASTSQISGFFNLLDISTPHYIIGTAGTDPLANCPDMGTNAPGSYISQPQCYQFSVDVRIVPGFGLRPGLYFLRIDYFIIQDL
jgi:hypothetical protein